MVAVIAKFSRSGPTWGKRPLLAVAGQDAPDRHRVGRVDSASGLQESDAAALATVDEALTLAASHRLALARAASARALVAELRSIAQHHCDEQYPCKP